MLFVLLRSLAFAPESTDPTLWPEYEAKSRIVMRPRIVGREKEGYQMVVRVAEVQA